jgi:hypothetical protein
MTNWERHGENRLSYFMTTESVLFEGLKKNTKRLWVVGVVTEMNEAPPEYTSDVLPHESVRTGTCRYVKCFVGACCFCLQDTTNSAASKILSFRAVLTASTINL